MHGRLKVKTSAERENEQRVKDFERACNFRNLTRNLFKLRPEINTPDDLKPVFDLTTELLYINPDFYTVWNIRREALLRHVEKNPDDAEEMWKKELLFTRSCLESNEKSYSTWQQRVWVLSKMPPSEYQSELKICDHILSRDERNFHCWDYRNYISDISGADIEKEFNFTTDKINSNFSNFSAWHRRHKLLLKGLSMPEGTCPKSCDLRLIWLEEYNKILDALYTDPNDQSPWLYHNWLVRNNFGQLGVEQVEKLKTLEELEPENRFIRQALLELSKIGLTKVTSSVGDDPCN